MIRNKMSGQPAFENEVVTFKGIQPLRLPIQFFAEGGEGGEGDKGQGEGDPPPGDGEGGDDEEISFADLIKQNPEYKQALNDRIEKAIKRRLKNINPEQKKPEDTKKPEGDGEGGDDPTQSAEYKTAITRAEKLENRTKVLEVKAFAANQEGFTKDHVKLIERLSAGRLKDLELDEDGKLDDEEVAEMVDAIVEEFPTLFAVADANQEQDPPGNTKRKQRQSGTNQQTNAPKDNKNKGVDEITARFERLQNKGRINKKKGE